MEEKISVTFENGKQIVVDYKTKAGDAVKAVEDDVSDILALTVNNEVVSFNHELIRNSTIDYIKYKSDDGYKIYSRTLKMLIYMSLKDMLENPKLEFISTINKDQYFTLSDVEITDEFVQKLKNKMIEYIKKDLVIVKKQVSSEEAAVLYEKSGNYAKLARLKHNLKSVVSMYFCGKYYNYFFGMLAPSTGYIKSFDLRKYKDGILLLIPNDNFDEGYNLSKVPEDTKLYDTFMAFNKLNEVIGVGNVAELNEAVITEKIGGIIRSCEAIHDRKIVEIVQEIEKRDKIKMILIAGPSSSGKTTFAQKLGVHLTLTGYRPITLSMDNYFKERQDTPLDENGKYDFETVDALDIDLFNKQLSDLAKGKEVEIPDFDFVTGHKKYKGHFLKLKENDILVIEGIHALNPILTKKTPDSQKYKIYIAPIDTLDIDDYTKVSSTDTRFLRRMVRDYVTRGHSVEKTFELWDNVVKGEKKYIFPFIDTADTIFNSSLLYEPGVMKTFAQPLLLQVQRDSKYYAQTRRLYEYLNNYLPVETGHIPNDSIIREFIGDGCFYR